METPWPAWTIAAHRSPERAPPASVISFLERLTTFVQAFDSAENRTSADVEFVKERFGYPEEDVKAWLETVKWTPDAREVKETVLRTTIRCVKAYITTLWIQTSIILDPTDPPVPR